MTSAAQRQIDWESADVHEGTLTVQLTGTATKGWEQHFKSVLGRLSRTPEGWEEVRLAKRSIKVSGVREGSEGDLCHLLESVVLQANADLQPNGNGGRPQEDEKDPARVLDERMTRTFQSFAPAPEPVD
jgi:hypothetical protein